MWDGIIALSNALISVSILPTIWAGRHDQPVPYATSFPMCVLLVTIGVGLFSSGLWLAALATFAGASLWGFVCGERLWQHLVARKG